MHLICYTKYPRLGEGLGVRVGVAPAVWTQRLQDSQGRTCTVLQDERVRSDSDISVSELFNGVGDPQYLI